VATVGRVAAPVAGPGTARTRTAYSAQLSPPLPLPRSPASGPPPLTAPPRRPPRRPPMGRRLGPHASQEAASKKSILLELCVSSLRRGHANLLERRLHRPPRRGRGRSRREASSPTFPPSTGTCTTPTLGTSGQHSATSSRRRGRAWGGRRRSCRRATRACRCWPEHAVHAVAATPAAAPAAAPAADAAADAAAPSGEGGGGGRWPRGRRAARARAAAAAPSRPSAPSPAGDWRPGRQRDPPTPLYPREAAG